MVAHRDAAHRERHRKLYLTRDEPPLGGTPNDPRQYDLCGDEAIDALCRACQGTLIDPEWDRNDRLWPLLDRAAAEHKHGRKQR